MGCDDAIQLQYFRSFRVCGSQAVQIIVAIVFIKNKSEKNLSPAPVQSNTFASGADSGKVSFFL